MIERNKYWRICASILMFDLSSLSEYVEKKQKIKKILRDFYFFLCCASVITFTGMNGIRLIRLWDIKVSAIGFAILATFFITFLRMFLILINKKVISDILKFFSSSQIDESFILFSKIIVSMQIFIAIGTPFLHLVAFIVNGQRTIPNLSTIPTFATGNEIYGFALLWMTWSIVNASCLMVTTELIVYGLLNSLANEFKILKSDFEKLKVENAEVVAKNIRELVIRQNDLFSIRDRLEEIFSPVFFCNFVMSSVVICGLFFSLFLCRSLLEIIPLANMSFVTLLGIYIQSFSGEMLRNASLDVSDGIYDCNWEEIRRTKVRKLLVLVMQRSQKSIALTALNFSDITLNGFVMVSFFNNMILSY